VVTLIGIGTNFVDNVYQVQSVSNVSVANTAIGIATVGAATTTSKKRYLQELVVFLLLIFPQQILLLIPLYLLLILLELDLVVDILEVSQHQITLETLVGEELNLQEELKENTYNFYGNNGVGGISTSGAVKRTLPLRFENYIIT
jgi:hypothetical protein